MTATDGMAEKLAQGWATLAEDYPLIGQAVRCHRNTRLGPMSFRANPSLVEMYADFPKLEGADVCKAVQTGVSELVIQMHLEAAGWRGRVAALVLPTHTLRDRFVQRRINPLFRDIPEYRERAGGGIAVAKDRKKGAENLKLKQFGDGALLFLGSNAQGDFVEFSADLLTIDEYDLCDAANVAKSRDRLRNSPYPQLFRIGNPEEGSRDGISAAYNEGDQRLFNWRCGPCGERQPIDWWMNVVHRMDDGHWEPRDTARYRALLANPKGPDIRPVCRKCSRPFERTPSGSAWVAARPGRRRSYRMSRLDVITDRLWDLFVQEWLPAQGKRVRLATFYRSVLGLPFKDSGAQLTQEHLERVSTGPENDFLGGAGAYGKELVVAGIDVGSVLNVVVDVLHLDQKGQRYRRAAMITAVPSFEAVREILTRFNVSVAVIDARPETRKAQELRDWALYEQGKTFVWLCQFFPTDRVGSEDYGRRLDYVDHLVTVDRTQLLDGTYDEIVAETRVLPTDSGSVPDFWEQMKAPARVLDEKGTRFIWSEGSDPDHYRLADSYARVAADLTQVGGSFVG